MDIDPKDIFLLFVGWVITKILDMIVKYANKALQQNLKTGKPKAKNKKRKRRK